MYQSSVRSATAGTGKTFLALVAILSLVLSALAITSPALATHQEDNPPIPITNDQGLGEWDDDIDCEGSHVKIDSEGTLVAGTHTYTLGDFWVTLTVVLDEDGEVESITIVDSSHDIDAVFTQGGNDVDGPETGSGPFTQSNGAAISFIVFCLGELQDADEFLEVIKNLEPNDDPGAFQVGFTGSTNATSPGFGGDGTTTGRVEVSAGTFAIVETPAEGTNLDDYTVTISCVVRGTATPVAVTEGSVTVGEGQDVVCTITNVREDEDEEILQVHKLECLAEDSSTVIADPEYVDPVTFPSLRILSEENFEDIGDCRLPDGVEFRVYVDANDNQVLDEDEAATEPWVTTTVDGIAHFTLPVGDYILVEPGTGDWPGGAIAFEIREGFRTIIDVTNNIGVLGSLLIAKVDEQGAPLGGAGFTVGEMAEVLDNGEGDLDERTGFVCVDDLELGATLNVSETTVPAGYEGAADRTVDVTVDADCATREAGPDTTFVNTAVGTGFVKVLKFFCTVEAPEGSDNPDFLVLDEDTDDASLPDQFADVCTRGGENIEAIFTLAGEGPWPTENGILLIEEVPLGTHTLAETSPLQGSTEVTLDEEGETITVFVFNFEEEDEEILQVHKFECLAEDSSTVISDPEYVEGVPFGTQGVLEAEESFDEIGDCRLPDGVEFLIYADVNGNEMLDEAEAEAEPWMTTTLDGIAHLDLPVGDYILVEEGTADWPGGSIAFEIREGNRTIIDVTNNIGVLGSLLIAKVDQTDDPLAGAGFTVDEGEEVLDADDGANDGFTCIDDLELGASVTVSETTVPAGYEGAADQTVDVTVDADCDSREAGADATFVNTAVETGFVKVLKYFCTVEAPEGTDNPDFLILDEDADDADLPDQFADVCSRGGENAEASFTLDSAGPFDTTNGILLIEEVPLGAYTLSETDPLVGSTADNAVVLDTEGETVTVFVFNFEGEGVAPSEDEEEEQQGQGTLGGQLPNTSTGPELTGSVPAALLALVMLTGLGAAGYAMQAEARRRR